jgi:cobalamin synthesis protein cobW-like protein
MRGIVVSKPCTCFSKRFAASVEIDEKRDSRLVFIGRGPPKERLKEELNPAASDLVSGGSRFDVIER